MCRPGRWWQPNAHHKPGWLTGNHPGKKAFTFIAPLGCLRLPLLWWYWLRRFYSELQNAGDQKTSVSGGYLTDPLYLSRLKGLLGIIIQSQISRPNQLSLVTAPEVGTKVGNDWRWWKKNHFWKKLFSRSCHPSDGKNQNVTPACSTFLTQILNELVFVDPGRGQSCGEDGAVFGLDN